MTTAESIVISGEYKNLSYAEMFSIAYKDFPNISDDDFKILFAKKILDKSSFGKKDSELDRWNCAIRFYRSGAFSIPPWFDDSNWIPTVEELSKYSKEEIDYLVESAVSDENDYLSDDCYEKYHNRAKRIKRVVEEYRNESNKGK